MKKFDIPNNADAEAAVLAQVLTDCQVPDPIPELKDLSGNPIQINDPWGYPIQIDVHETPVSHTAPSLTHDCHPIDCT